MTVAAVLLVAVVIAGVVFLERGEVDRELPPPEVSYELLRNEGRTAGVPIAIKLNQIAVFMISDPMEGGTGADRSKQIVAALERGIEVMRAEPGRRITLDTSGPMPAIVQSRPDDSDRSVLVQLTEGDRILSGDTEVKRLARLWAERLTDTLKVLMFGEPPKFTIGTEFGSALEALYVGAMGEMGMVSKANLDAAFANLSDDQKSALETLPQLPPLETPAEGDSGE